MSAGTFGSLPPATDSDSAGPREDSWEDALHRSSTVQPCFEPKRISGSAVPKQVLFPGIPEQVPAFAVLEEVTRPSVR